MEIKRTYLRDEKYNQFRSSVNNAVNGGQYYNVYWNSSNSISKYQINIKLYKNIMKTEITDIEKWTYMYNNPKNTNEFSRAFKELKKVHDKYGTIEISIIKQLIN